PESSRLARLASGGAHGFAQSFFQVGGHVGSALGPLLAAFVVLPQGRGSLAWFGFGGAFGDVLPGGRWAVVQRRRSLRSDHVRTIGTLHHVAAVAGAAGDGGLDRLEVFLGEPKAGCREKFLHFGFGRRLAVQTRVEVDKR
ncbi:MAG: hypothetical protein WB347_00110, partial [Terriglobales bacterium]